MNRHSEFWIVQAKWKVWKALNDKQIYPYSQRAWTKTVYNICYESLALKWIFDALKPSLLRYNEGFIQFNSFYIPKEHDCVRNGHTYVLNKRLGNVFRLCSIRYSDLERKQPRRC